MTVSEQWRAKPTRFMWNRLTPDEQWAEVERLQAENEQLRARLAFDETQNRKDQT